MAKAKQGLSKKGLPLMQRVKNSEGKRVWKVNGEEISTLREVIARYKK